jgi:hypothetical protein
MTSHTARGCLLACCLALLACSSAQSLAAGDDGEPPPPGILEEVTLPPAGLSGAKAKEPVLDLKGTSGKKYVDREDPQSAYCKAIQTARVLLWASSTVLAPKRLAKDVSKMKKELKLNPNFLEARFLIPRNPKAEPVFKERVLAVNQSIARVVARMEDVLEELKGFEGDEKSRPPRWQANLALVRASLMLRTAHLEDFSLALGSLRKEFPPHGKEDRAWRLKPSGRVLDFSARKRAKEAFQLLKQLRQDHPGTVWDQQAEHFCRTMLGVEWEAVK